MPQPEPILSACRACAEPLEPGDLFCGACGVAAKAVPHHSPDSAGTAGHRPPIPDPREGFLENEPADGAVREPGQASAAAPGRPPGPPPRHPPAPDRGREGGGRAPVRPGCVACGLGTVDADGYCDNCGHVQPRPRDHQERELKGVAAVSDRGLRHHRNEDAFALAATALPDGTPTAVAVVCDGVSSASRPDEASATAADTISGVLLDALARGASQAEAMREALVSGARAVSDLALDKRADHEQPPRLNAPACTCVSAVTAGRVFSVGWVGDSRAYWVPDDRSRPSSRLTEDDSWAAHMVAAGIMSEAEAYADERAHAITGWLGADALELDPHTASFEPDEPGVVVVCTDGLWNYAESSAEMAAAVPPDARLRPLHAARTLVGLALDGGGHDNITVAVIPFPTTGGGTVTDPPGRAESHR